MTEIVRQEYKIKLERLLGTSTQCIIRLKEILSDERAALEREDVKALSGIAVDKQLRLSKLDDLEAKRSEMCGACGFGSGPEDMLAMARWCGDDSLISDCWNDYIDIASECNEMNKINGAVIRMRRHQARSTLSLLRCGTQDNEIYDPSGREENANLKRVLAQA